MPESNSAQPAHVPADAPSPSPKIVVTFPDGARREYPAGTSGLDIAKGISPSLAKRTVAMALDGMLADLADPIAHDAKIEFIGPTIHAPSNLSATTPPMCWRRRCRRCGRARK